MWCFYWLKKNHTILPDKLNYYVLRGIVNQWFSSYLSNRTQTTEIGSHRSTKLNINCGVPQGSVLGLFLLYINDVEYSSSNLQFFLFADDTNALHAHKDLKTLELTVNAELHNFYNWLTSNKLSLDIKKSNYVIFFPYQKKNNYDPQVNVFDNESSKKVTHECILTKHVPRPLNIFILKNLDSMSNEMLFCVLRSKFGMGYLKFSKKEKLPGLPGLWILGNE